MHDADSAAEPLLAELAALRQQHAALAAALADQQRAERESDARFRDLIGSSRKTSQLLLERFDADGVTRRVGDERVLRRSAARR